MGYISCFSFSFALSLSPSLSFSRWPPSFTTLSVEAFTFLRYCKVLQYHETITIIGNSVCHNLYCSKLLVSVNTRIIINDMSSRVVKSVLAEG